ncbi:acetyl-CoA hydrolase/transferase family protein [Megasphaera vaginalis (ex Bordigoni et al. 2020)]|uniref:acetyl-CoA hydrolase/transferase family protein n=1 Tax=Megasphaera vaginalis (ex Bordigoni et al. 2020) TaxID=2045301 RepID=UPI000C7A7043|nr:acetyl-CoA hydrolase/transferase C-terminal domain-containing protein [Megasphaera vaginalis (ex Bordigoni et al. 2020)]
MYAIASLSEMYRKKLVTPAQAVSVVKSGQRVSYGFGCSVPLDLDRALAERIRNGELQGLEICYTTTLQEAPYAVYTASDSNEQVRFMSGHFNGFDRNMNKDGRCWFMPILLNELPKYWRHIDVLMIQVHPMDKWGNFNLGPQAGDLIGELKAADIVIVEVNKNIPKALGYETELNLANVDYIIEGSNSPMPCIPNKPASDSDNKIADIVVSMIEDGSTLQLGIGSLPSAIGTKLAQSDVGDLSGHTEMLVDSYVDLYEAGKITGNKNRDKGKIMYGFAGGTQRLYDFIDNNQVVFNAPVSYVNNIGVVSGIDKFISINGCVNLDLYGQVCSETAGYRHVSGTGGQMDFAQGAFLSNGGKSFICLHSTRSLKDGRKESLIRPLLVEGSVVTTPRSAVHYIVTEYGYAMLKGKSTWQRAEALINIAHPDFRDELIKEAEKMGIWKRSSKLMI